MDASRSGSIARAVAVFAVLAAASVAHAAPATELRLAVLELRDSAGLPAAEAPYLTDRVRGGASRALPVSRVLVLTRESLEPLLPHGTTLADCATGECEVEIGRRAGADYVMSGEVLRFGGALRLLVKLHHCGSAAFLGSETVAGDDVTALERGLDGATARLCVLLRQHAGLVLEPSADSLKTPTLTAVPLTSPPGRSLDRADSIAIGPRRGSGHRAGAERVAVRGEAHTHATADTAVVVRDEFMWTARDNGRDLDWHEAWRYCGSCRDGAADDWRLPTIEELETLRERDMTGATDSAPAAAIAREFRLSGAALWSVSMARAGVALRYDFTRDLRTRAAFGDSRGARVLCVRRVTD